MLTSYTAELIQKGKIHDLKGGHGAGWPARHDDLRPVAVRLYQEGAISLEEALNHADSRNNLALRIRLDAGETGSSGSGIGPATERSHRLSSTALSAPRQAPAIGDNASIMIHRVSTK